MRMAVVLLCAVIGSGCVSTDTPREKRSFVLDAVRPITVTGPQEGPILRLAPVRISSRYERKEMVYRVGELRYQADPYNGFFSAPEAMLNEILLAWLTATGQFKHVMSGGGALLATHSLEVTVTALHGDFRDPEVPLAVLVFEIVLVDETQIETKLVLRKQYSQSMPLQASSTEALVVAWNDGLRRILEHLEQDLGGLE